MCEPILTVSGLHKTFPSGDARLHVLADLELALQAGEMLAVTGASGCGKSTFLHLVGAMESPDRGSICFDGVDVTRLDTPARAEFRNREVGFVFQFHHLLPEFTARENVMMPLLLRRAAWSDAVARADRLLGQLGLAQRLHHRPGQLSGGEQQRVALARALAGKPRLLLADEPTGNLDEQTSVALQDLLVRVHRELQLTSIVVTHDARLAARCQVRKQLEGGRLRESR